MSTPTLNHPVVDAVLSAASSVLGMELVFIGTLDEEYFTFARVEGSWDGIDEGARLDRSDSLCHRMLASSGPVASQDVATDPLLGDAPVVDAYGIASYVGVPVTGPGGAVIATLCGLDHDRKSPPDLARSVLEQLAKVLAAHLGGGDEVVIRRTPQGWAVGDDAADDLTSAMVLADLLAGEPGPTSRPEKPAGPLDETAQLRLSIKQLEHALAARVVVEQAIGVLTERQHQAPREVFERLRRTARSSGRKVVDLARLVVASSVDPSVTLPGELSRPGLRR